MARRMPAFLSRTVAWFADLLWVRLLGQKADSEFGSNTRRLMSRVSIATIGVLTLEVVLTRNAAEIWKPEAIGTYLAAYSVAFFVFVIVVVPFLTSGDFVLNPFRLFVDGVVSICLVILTFALCYRNTGLVPPRGESLSSVDFVYFSAVTFSTLGYGDIRPMPSSRILAGLEALIGNLHLGIIVGAAFLAATYGRRK